MKINLDIKDALTIIHYHCAKMLTKLDIKLRNVVRFVNYQENDLNALWLKPFYDPDKSTKIVACGFCCLLHTHIHSVIVV